MSDFPHFHRFRLFLDLVHFVYPYLKLLLYASAPLGGDILYSAVVRLQAIVRLQVPHLRMKRATICPIGYFRIVYSG